MYQYKSIEVCRGVAALLVAIYHLSRLYQQNYGVFPFSSITEIGHIGVDFFFVLSGFIIYYIHAIELGDKSKVSSYAVKRFSRVYPFFWFVILLNLILIPFVSSKELPTFFQLFLNLSLLPYKDYFITGVSWTLQHEILFYSLFACLFVNKSLGKTLLILWLILIILASQNDYFKIPVISSSFNIQFFFGLGVAYLLKKQLLPKSKFILLISLFIVGTISTLELTDNLSHNGIISRVLYGMAFSLIIIGCISTEHLTLKKFPKIFLKLGSSSYSIYLLHLFFGGILFKIFTVVGLHDLVPITISAITLIVLTVYLSYITSTVIEIPLSKSVRNYLLNRVKNEKYSRN